MNYTYGKAMGIVNPALDQFNLNNDYGVQPANRTHIFNAAYSDRIGQSGERQDCWAASSTAGSSPASRSSRAVPTLPASQRPELRHESERRKIPGTGLQHQQRVAAGYAEYPAQSRS